MSQLGLVNIQCPSCGRLFLTPPQQGGGPITCPHCAYSGPITTYYAAPTQSVSPAEPVAFKRRVARQPDPAPAFQGHLYAGQQARFPQPYLPGVQPGPGGAPAYPPGYEQWAAAARLMALKHDSAYPPGYEQWAAAGYPQQVPPAYMQVPQQPGMMPQPYPQPWPAPAVAFQPPPQPAYRGVPQNWPPSGQDAYPAHAPVFPAADSAAMPGWPGLGSASAQTRGAVVSLPDLSPLDEGAIRQAPALTDEEKQPWVPPRQSSNAKYFLALVLLGVGAVIYFLWDDLVPPTAKPDFSYQTQTRPDGSGMVAIANPQLNNGQPADLTEPLGEVRKATKVTRPDVNLVDAAKAAPKLLETLLSAQTSAERAKLILSPKEHAKGMESYLAKNSFKIINIKPVPAVPKSLADQTNLAVFQVTTDKNAHGALLHIVPTFEGSYLMNWPLFEQTHERSLAALIQREPSEEPEWQSVALVRVHGLEQPESVRSQHFLFSVQGSGDDSTLSKAMVLKDSTIGRFLARQAEWETIYLARLLVRVKPVEGKAKILFIHDCDAEIFGEG